MTVESTTPPGYHMLAAPGNNEGYSSFMIGATINVGHGVWDCQLNAAEDQQQAA